MKQAVAGQSTQGTEKTVLSGAGRRPSLGGLPPARQDPTERSFVFEPLSPTDRDREMLELRQWLKVFIIRSLWIRLK